MITISVCMIVRDEEEVIGRCLESVYEIADEIIIVDTGSADSTISQAKKYTDKIYFFKWENDFSKARNYSFSFASCDYILWLDADDIITEENKKKFLKLKMTLKKDIDVVMMKYHSSFDDYDNPTSTHYRERLLKREKNFKWQGVVHEVILTNGKIEYSDIAISHKKPKKRGCGRNLEIYEMLLDKGIKLNTLQKYYYARELFCHKHYARAADFFYEFLSSTEACEEYVISAYLDLSECFYALDDKEKSLDALYTCFKYSYPRAEVCCSIGNYNMNAEKYDNSIFWYKAALLCEKDIKGGGLILEDCYGYLPYIQLAICFYKKGDIKEAIKYNDLAGKIKPYDYIYNNNKKIFDSII